MSFQRTGANRSNDEIGFRLSNDLGRPNGHGDQSLQAGKMCLND